MIVWRFFFCSIMHKISNNPKRSKGTFSGLCRKNQKSSQKTENERGEKSLWHKAFRPRTCVKKTINSCYTSAPFFDVRCSNLLSGYGRSDCKAFSDRPSRRCFALFWYQFRLYVQMWQMYVENNAAFFHACL